MRSELLFHRDLELSSVKPWKRCVTGGLNRSGGGSDAPKPEPPLTQLFSCQDSGLSIRCSAASELKLGVSSPARSYFCVGHFFKNLIGFLGKLRQRCCVFLFCFLRRASVSQSSRQGAPEISQGSLIGWWAETPHPPLLWTTRGGWFPLPQTDLTKANSDTRDNKTKTPLFIATHVLLIIQHCNDLHLPPDFPKHMERETFNKKKRKS